MSSIARENFLKAASYGIDRYVLEDPQALAASQNNYNLGSDRIAFVQNIFSQKLFADSTEPISMPENIVAVIQGYNIDNVQKYLTRIGLLKKGDNRDQISHLLFNQITDDFVSFLSEKFPQEASNEVSKKARYEILIRKLFNLEKMAKMLNKEVTTLFQYAYHLRWIDVSLLQVLIQKIEISTHKIMKFVIPAFFSLSREIMVISFMGFTICHALFLLYLPYLFVSIPSSFLFFGSFNLTYICDLTTDSAALHLFGYMIYKNLQWMIKNRHEPDFFNKFKEQFTIEFPSPMRPAHNFLRSCWYEIPTIGRPFSRARERFSSSINRDIAICEKNLKDAKLAFAKKVWVETLEEVRESTLQKSTIQKIGNLFSSALEISFLRAFRMKDSDTLNPLKGMSF
jgi:hypothetical protein